MHHQGLSHNSLKSVVSSRKSSSRKKRKKKKRHGSILWTVCIFIVIYQFCEGLAYFGLEGSLVLFLQDNVDMSNADADNQYAL